MRTFQLVDISAASPYERGFQYGRQAESKIQSSIYRYKEFLCQGDEGRWADLERYAMEYVPLIEQFMPDVFLEATGVADGALVNIEDIMVLNCRYEITKFAEPAECTTCAVLPPASSDGKVLLAKNWDLSAGVIDNIVILRIDEMDGTKLIGIAEAGQLMREGFNSFGIGLCNNSLQSVYDKKGVGVPVTFLRRKVLATKTFEDAKRLLITAPRTVSNNMLLVSSRGAAVNIEAHPLGVNLLEPLDGILTHANHFVDKPELNALEPSPRDRRLNQILRDKYGSIDVEWIKICMGDHANYPYSICRHPSDVTLPLANRGITVASLIIEFNANMFHVCAGPPCEGEFATHAL